MSLGEEGEVQKSTESSLCVKHERLRSGEGGREQHFSFFFDTFSFTVHIQFCFLNFNYETFNQIYEVF
jgi:hypothetical protein